MFTVKAVIIECNTCKARYELKTGDSFECNCTAVVGGEEEDFADISLAPGVYGLNSALRFGKHKDKTVLEILKEDPGYIEWCLKNITHFSISDTVRTKLVMLRNFANTISLPKYDSFLDEQINPSLDDYDDIPF